METTHQDKFESLFDGTAASFARWRPIGPGEFTLTDGEILACGVFDFALLYFTPATFDDFILRLEFSIADPLIDNSGVFVRFRDPMLLQTQDVLARNKFQEIERNKAWIAAYSGFEVQIDEQARGKKIFGEPDGLDKYRTGAIYGIPTAEPRLQEFEPAPPLAAGEWNEYEIAVVENTYAVKLNGRQTTKFVNRDTARGLSPKLDPASGYIGLQGHADSCVAFRNIRIKRL
jgi:hypothetical protein